MTDNYPDNTVEYYFQYKPSLALSLVALVFFFLISVVIAVQTIKYRPRCRFMWIVVFTGGLEVAGYISHVVASQSVNSNAYLSYLVFTILAPNFLALANYIAVGRLAEQLQLSGEWPLRLPWRAVHHMTVLLDTRPQSVFLCREVPQCQKHCKCFLHH